MRKVLLAGIISVLTVLLLYGHGCALPVQSLLPFYTDENEIDIPEEMIGTFTLKALDGGRETIILSIDEYSDTLKYTQKFMRGDEEGAGSSSTHEIVFFKINNHLFADMILERVESIDRDNFPLLAVSQLTRVHTFVMIVPTENGFKVYLPEAGNAVKLIEENSIDLPYVKIGKYDYIFTASGEQWHAFLEKYAEALFNNKDENSAIPFLRSQDAEEE